MFFVFVVYVLAVPSLILFCWLFVVVVVHCCDCCVVIVVIVVIVVHARCEHALPFFASLCQCVAVGCCCCLSVSLFVCLFVCLLSPLLLLLLLLFVPGLFVIAIVGCCLLFVCCLCVVCCLLFVG